VRADAKAHIGAITAIAEGSSMSRAYEPAGSDAICPDGRPAAATDAELRRAAAAFARPSIPAGLLQLLTSFGPFAAGCAAMYLVCPISCLLTLALALPTGVLLVRIFIIQHDCGHGSFFASRRANAIVGRLCSILTLAPYANWGRQHGVHHASWNNLGRDTGSDIYSTCLTLREYLARSRWQRFLYRLPRHPLIANLLLPPLVFVLLYRLPFDTPRNWSRERRSVYMTNVALVALFGALAALLGWREVLLVHLPVMVVASIVGVWLFTLQHRFETAHWATDGDWNFVDAALRGSSWFGLPRVLHWLTGNIGFHHVHHLNPRIPNYRLRAAHEAMQALRPTRPLRLRAGLDAPWLTLWDEARGRLVRFRDAGKAA
jgi:omega-6 fatty acid desaturase (delta-12 desaturase)